MADIEMIKTSLILHSRGCFLVPSNCIFKTAGRINRRLKLILPVLDESIFGSMVVPMNIISQVEHQFYDSQFVLQSRSFLELIHLQPPFG